LTTATEIGKRSRRRELTAALAATLCFGAAAGIVTAALNNYLADIHSLDASARGWLEFPRELPGFLIMFVAGGLLLWMRETQMAALAMLFTLLGAIGLGYFTPGAAALAVWVAIYSLGDHIIFAVEGPIGLKMAQNGGEGKRLGQFGGARNLGVIIGVALVFGVSKLLGDRYDLFFALSAVWALAAGWLYMSLHTGRSDAPSKKIVIKKKYGLFYAISAIFGIRKQIFLVFGAWVLVSLHDVPVSTIALLYFIAAMLGAVMRPLLGEVIDWLDERTVLAVDELLLALICMVFAFAGDILSAPYALWLLYGAYIADNVLFALRVARTTYLKKIADEPGDITPTISMGITIDHAVAMTLPIFSGYVWDEWGFRWVFVMAAALAVVGFFLCLRIRIPKPAEAAA